LFCVGVKPGLTLREEHRLMVFENRLLRRIFGPKMEEVAGGWRRMHNEELHNLGDQMNEDEMGRICITRTGEMKDA